MITLNDKSHVSMYYQLKQIFLDKILKHEWKAQEKIPNEFELCKLFNVSRITVRQALAELEKEGYLVRKQGKGTFVSFPKIEQNLASFYSFTEEFRKKGFTPGSKVLEFRVEDSGETIADKLGLEKPGEKVYYIKRLRCADHILIAIESTYLPVYIFPELTHGHVSEKPLYDIIREDYRVVPDTAEESFGAVLLGDEDARHFGLKKGAAALDIERFTRSGGRCIEYTRGVIRGDIFRFHVKLGQ